MFMRSMLLATVALFASPAAGHAEFLMADSTFHKDSEGRMYCHAPFTPGDMVMGKTLVEGGNFSVNVTDSNGTPLLDGDKFVAGAPHFIHFTGAFQPGEFIFIAEGATFKEGGCLNTRSTLDGVEIVMPNNGDVTFRAGHGNCAGEPPLPCQIYVTPTIKLSSKEPLK